MYAPDVSTVASDVLLDEVAIAAEDAFWEVVRANFPEVKTGDLPPDLSVGSRERHIHDIKWWLHFNHPKLAERR